MTDRILIVLTSHATLGDTGRGTGFYLPEVAHPWRVFSAAGYAVDLVSVRGGAPPMDGRDDSDPVQAAFLADPEMSRRLADTRRPSDVDPSAYRAVLYAGGHGAMWDLPGDAGLAAIGRDVHGAGGVVAAVCHGPAGLVGLTLHDGRSIVDGRAVTGFSNSEEEAVGLTGVVPFLLADRLAALGGRYLAAPDFQPHVVTDGRLVTGQNPASATGVADAVVRVLAEGGSAPVVATTVTVDATMRGYLARPAGEGAYPGVILGHQLFGVDGQIRRFADRLAAAGYVVLAPDLFHRVDPGLELPADDDGRARGFEVLGKLTADAVIADVAAAARFLSGLTGPRIGMVGLSTGGHFAVLALSTLDIAVAVVLYPGWLTRTDLPFPQEHPTLHRVGGIGGRLLLMAGGEDPVIPAADREAIAAALTGAGVRHEIVVYPDTPHAFALPGAPTYREGPAADAWNRLTAALADELGGPFN